MKRPVIVIDGSEHKVHSVSWYDNDSLCSVSFFVGDEHYTAFNKNSWDKEGFKEDGTAYFDLYKCLKWGEPSASM